MDEKEKALFDNWQNGDLSKITEALKIVLEKTDRPIPIESFNKVIHFLAQTAYKWFTEVIGADNPENIPENFRHNLLSEIVSSFNSVLPDGFPYVVAALFSKSEPEKIRIGCIQRDIIPGAHDIISKKILFIVELELENELPDGKCAIMDFHVDRVSFLGGEKLPEF